MRYWLWFISIPLTLYSEIIWQDQIQDGFSIELRLSPEKLTLGEEISFQAVFHYPQNYKLDTSVLIDQLVWTPNPLQPHIAINQKENSLKKQEEKYQTQTFKLLLNPLIAGPLYLSLMKVSFTPLEKESKPIFIFTPVFEINVLNTPKLNLQTPLPIGPLFPLEPQFPLDLTEANRQFLFNPSRLNKEAQHNEAILAKHTFPWLSLLTLFFSALGFWLIKKIKLARDNKANQIKPLMPYQKAYQNLNHLEKQRFIKIDELKAFYSHLTSLVLSYFEERFHLNLKPYTTDERSTLLSSTFPQDLNADFLAFFNYMDQIKFASLTPSLEDSQQLLQTAKKLIDKGEAIFQERLKDVNVFLNQKV